MPNSLPPNSALPVTYIATARITDDAEFSARIAHHRERRPAHWACSKRASISPAPSRKATRPATAC